VRSGGRHGGIGCPWGGPLREEWAPSGRQDLQVLRIAIDGTGEGELVADALWQLGAVAVAERDRSIDAGFSTDDEENRARAELERRLPAGTVERIDVDESQWAEVLRSTFEATAVRDVCVRPPWIAPVASAGFDVVIEPGAAFGTGNHPTTRLALEALLDHVEPGSHVLDIGTGTGVLAIVAARVGASRVEAVDIDAHALAVAQANVERNGVAGAVRVYGGGLDAIDDDFDVVVANLGGLLAPVSMVDDLDRLARATVIVSGLLAPAQGGLPIDQLDEVFAHRGFSRAATNERGGWVAAVWQRVDDRRR